MTDRQHPIIALTLARLREFIRQPETMFWVYGFPLIMVLVLGMAFRNKPPEAAIIDVLDNGHGQAIVELLEANPQFKVALVSPEDVSKRLRAGKAAILVIASQDVENFSELTDLEFQFDPDRPGSQAARDQVNQVIQQAAGRRDPVSTRDLVFEEPGGSYVDFLVPGLLGMSVMGGGLWGVGFAIVDMRIRKLLKRFMATPMKRAHFLIAMMASRLTFMWPQVLVLLVFSYFVFDVRIYGSWLAIGLVILIGAIEFACIGLLVAARAKTLESVSGLMNLVMLPMWTLSGIFFSYENFPQLVQPLIRCLPLTPLIDALRGLMMDGESLFSLGPEIGIMLAWSVIPFAIALAIFRWND